MLEFKKVKSSKKVLPDFPIPCALLCSIYKGYKPRFETKRSSLDDIFLDLLKKHSSSDLQIVLDKNFNRWTEIFRQRFFYRSTTAFYRCFQLFLAYLILDRHVFSTWAEITGYYSRFYFVQALLNLLQCSLVHIRKTSNGRFNNKFLIYNSGKRICFYDSKSNTWKSLFKTQKGSHQVWWLLFNEIGRLADCKVEDLDFVLNDYYHFSCKRRNVINYSHNYLEGFIELEWFDTDLEKFQAHLTSMPRRDRDITNIERFFNGSDPDFCDSGDFYGDSAPLLWKSIEIYLRLLNSLPFEQNFITLEKLELLSIAHIQNIFPIIHEGIIKSIREIID